MPGAERAEGEHRERSSPAAGARRRQLREAERRDQDGGAASWPIETWSGGSAADGARRRRGPRPRSRAPTPITASAPSSSPPLCTPTSSATPTKPIAIPTSRSPGDALARRRCGRRAAR